MRHVADSWGKLESNHLEKLADSSKKIFVVLRADNNKRHWMMDIIIR